MAEKNTWSEITLVTALVNIGREQIDGRSFQDYVNWFLQTIQIPAPMVVYAEPILKEIVLQIRKELPTKFIPTSYAQMPLAWSTSLVQSILENPDFKKKMKKPQDLTNRCSGYPIVTNSKFPWLWNVIQENPFQTDLIFWIDGGISRFWKGTNPVLSCPHPNLVKLLQEKKKIYAQIGGFQESIIHNAFQGLRLPEEDILGANPSYIMGGFFGGTLDCMKQLCEESMILYIREMIQKQRIDHDQAALFWFFQNHLDKFLFLPPHPTLDAFNFLFFASGHTLV